MLAKDSMLLWRRKWLISATPRLRTSSSYTRHLPPSKQRFCSIISTRTALPSKMRPNQRNAPAIAARREVFSFPYKATETFSCQRCNDAWKKYLKPQAAP